ncbi:hypothetical protein TrVFT333_007121 [Trichoderma virens FT-333]|nr:hypothetical protein TrVFT333_007121 [Trichoderma virens FT-333]
MGGLFSSLNKGTNPDDYLELVRYVLPILKELARHLEQALDSRDRLYRVLGNIKKAVTLLNGHLGAIKEAGKAHRFAEQITRLADLLEEVFNKVIDFPLLQKKKLFRNLAKPAYKHPRLRAVQKLIPKTNGWQERLSKLAVVPIACQEVAWDHLQDAFKKLLKQFELQDELSNDRPQPPMTSPEASGELIAFADHVFSKLHKTCNMCDGAPKREVRLRIGTYRRGKQGQGVKCLCILLAPDDAQHIWHDVSVHDIQQLK